MLSIRGKACSRRGAGAVERGGLENRCGACTTVGSNPTLSAKLFLPTVAISARFEITAKRFITSAVPNAASEFAGDPGSLSSATVRSVATRFVGALLSSNRAGVRRAMSNFSV